MKAFPPPICGIRTWTDYRRELGRSTFGVLRTATGGGTFVLKESAETLFPEASDTSQSWFGGFRCLARTTFINDLRQAAVGLSENASANISSVGRKLVEILERANSNSLAATFSALVGEVGGIQSLVSGLKEVTDKKIHAALNLQLNRDKGIQSMRWPNSSMGFGRRRILIPTTRMILMLMREDASPRTGRAAAVTAYMQAGSCPGTDSSSQAR